MKLISNLMSAIIRLAILPASTLNKFIPRCVYSAQKTFEGLKKQYQKDTGITLATGQIKVDSSFESEKYPKCEFETYVFSPANKIAGKDAPHAQDIICYLNDPSQTGEAKQKIQNWLDNNPNVKIMFPGNTGHCGRWFEEALSIAKNTNTTIFVVNHIGVGESCLINKKGEKCSSWLTKKEKLVGCAKNFAQYIIEKTASNKVDPKKRKRVVVSGFSIGGFVAAQVVFLLNKMGITANFNCSRTLSSLEDIATYHIMGFPESLPVPFPVAILVTILFLPLFLLKHLIFFIPYLKNLLEQHIVRPFVRKALECGGFDEKSAGNMKITSKEAYNNFSPEQRSINSYVKSKHIKIFGWKLPLLFTHIFDRVIPYQVSLAQQVLKEQRTKFKEKLIRLRSILQIYDDRALLSNDVAITIKLCDELLGDEYKTVLNILIINALKKLREYLIKTKDSSKKDEIKKHYHAVLFAFKGNKSEGVSFWPEQVTQYLRHGHDTTALDNYVSIINKIKYASPITTDVEIARDAAKVFGLKLEDVKGALYEPTKRTGFLSIFNIFSRRPSVTELAYTAIVNQVAMQQDAYS